MYLSRKITRLIGGDIIVKSEYNKGSKFTVELPLDVNTTVEEENKDENNENFVFSMPSTSRFLLDANKKPIVPNPKILVVEDCSLNAFVMVSLIKRLNICCEKAENGKIAIDLIMSNNKKENYALIFMDINMPIMNGIDVLIYF